MYRDLLRARACAFCMLYLFGGQARDRQRSNAIRYVTAIRSPAPSVCRHHARGSALLLVHRSIGRIWEAPEGSIGPHSDLARGI